MASGKLKSVSAWLISFWTLVLFLISGCAKSPAKHDEEMREVSMTFCKELLADPRVSKEAKSRAELVLQKRKNDYVDPEPILVQALLVEVEWKQTFYLVPYLSDEDGDIAGIGVRERHLQPNGQTMIIEELYPVFCYASTTLATSPMIPVMIRKNGERKNEQLWQKYLNMGFFNPKLMPSLWISTPQPGKVDVDVWIYDRSGHNSEPVPLDSGLNPTAGPLEIKLTAPRNLIVGERPNLVMEITNISDKPVEFVRPLDGSWHHWRYPHISLKVADENGNTCPLALVGRCGNMNAIVADHIRQLKPGARETFALGWSFNQRGFEQPGRYNLTLSYDLKAPDIDAWVIAGRGSREKASAKLAKRLKRIPKLLLTTPSLTITVHPITTTMLEQMIAQYFRRRNIGFVENDLQLRKWNVSDIRQSVGHISCKLEFAENYAPPPKPGHVPTGYWFQQGRYLFAPVSVPVRVRSMAQVLSSQALCALPNDPQVATFQLHLPYEAQTLGRKHSFLKGLGFSLPDTTPNDAQLLITFLHQQTLNEDLKQTVKDVIDRSQVIFARYKKSLPITTPLHSEDTHKLIRAISEKVPFSNPNPITHHINGDVYQGLYVIFRRPDKSHAAPVHLLENIRLPVNAGYRLENAEIIYAPLAHAKNITLDRCSDVVERIANELDGLMLQLKEIKWKDNTKESAGKWAGKEWPDYPKISYVFKFQRSTPNTTTGHEKSIEQWCEIKLWFKPEMGSMVYKPCYHRRKYRRQGIIACWLVSSTDASFEDEVTQVITTSLEPLDTLEKELATKW